MERNQLKKPFNPFDCLERQIKTHIKKKCFEGTLPSIMTQQILVGQESC